MHRLTVAKLGPLDQGGLEVLLLNTREVRVQLLKRLVAQGQKDLVDRNDQVVLDHKGQAVLGLTDQEVQVLGGLVVLGREDQVV